jgi:hypothetical protein
MSSSGHLLYLSLKLIFGIIFLKIAKKYQMRSIKYIALSVFLALGVFFAVLYTSCSKDSCKTVTCLNGGSCGGGACMCPPGTGSTNCQTVYKTLYTNTYIGNAYYTSSIVDTNYIPHIDTNSTLVFSAGNDSNFNKMDITWNRTSGKPVKMVISLTNNTATGSNFSVSSAVSDTNTYSGKGSVNSNTASISLIESHPNSPAVVVSLNNFNKQ